MQVVERSSSHQVITSTGQHLATFGSRLEADAFAAGYHRAVDDVHRVVKRELEATELAIMRTSA